MPKVGGDGEGDMVESKTQNPRRNSRLHVATNASAAKRGIHRSSSRRSGPHRSASGRAVPIVFEPQDDRTVCISNVEHAHVLDILRLFDPITGVKPVMVSLDEAGTWMVHFASRDEAARALRKVHQRPHRSPSIACTVVLILHICTYTHAHYRVPTAAGLWRRS